MKLTGWFHQNNLTCKTNISGRVEAQRAGTRQVLVIHNLQESDYGPYMCYATNSIGSIQKIIEITAEDKDNNKIDFGQSQGNEKNEESVKDLNRNYRVMKNNFDNDRKSLIKMRHKMEKEIEIIKNELSLKIRKGVGMEEPFEKAILADLGKLEIQNVSLNYQFMQKGLKTSTEV